MKSLQCPSRLASRCLLTPPNSVLVGFRAPTDATLGSQNGGAGVSAKMPYICRTICRTFAAQICFPLSWPWMSILEKSLESPWLRSCLRTSSPTEASAHSSSRESGGCFGRSMTDRAMGTDGAPSRLQHGHGCHLRRRPRPAPPPGAASKRSLANPAARGRPRR